MPFAWLRHLSRQLLCPAARIVQSSFITLHYVAFAHNAPTNPRLTPLHFVSFIPHSLSRLQSTRCQLLCSPALSSGLRAVMIFALLEIGLRRIRADQQQKITPALVRCSRAYIIFFKQRSRGFPHCSHRPPAVGLIAHTLPPARVSLREALRSPRRLAICNSIKIGSCRSGCA